jgi:hypothetical protein
MSCAAGGYLGEFENTSGGGIDGLPCFGEMFSSCFPCSAFVDGVKMGSESF